MKWHPVVSNEFVSGGNKSSVATAAGLIVLSLGLAALFVVYGFLFVQVVLTVASGVALILYGKKLVKQKDGPAILLCAFPLATTWFLFGYGGVITLRYPMDIRSTFYGVAYEDWAFMELSLAVLLSAIAYYIMFNTLYKPRKISTLTSFAGDRDIQKLLSIALIGLLALDVYMRYKYISAGVYFGWFIDSFGDTALQTRRSGLLARLQPLAWPVVLALATAGWRLGNPRHRWIYKSIVAFELVASLMTGGRRYIVLALVVLAVSWLVLGGFKRNDRIITIAAVTVILFAGIVGPVIQEARYLMKEDRDLIVMSPAEIPGLFLTKYIPQAVMEGDFYSQDAARIQRDATVSHRLGSYAVYASSINQRAQEGAGYMSDESLFATLSTLVPNAVLPRSGGYDASLAVYNHFGIGTAEQDVGGTPITDVFAHLGIVGAVLLMGLIGAGYGFVASVFSQRLGLVGVLATAAFVFHTVPIGDSFSFYIADVRNAVLIACVILISRPNSRPASRVRPYLQARYR